MKKYIIGIVIVIISFIIVQTFRFNYNGRDINEFKFYDLNHTELKLQEVFDSKNNKLILYIIPDCESCTVKFQSIIRDKKYSNYQFIIISVGLKNFDFKKFYNKNLSMYNVSFLIDFNNKLFG